MRGVTRVREWVGRYAPAEGLSLLATLMAAAAARACHRSDVSTALAATWAGNLAYYGLIVVRDVRRSRDGSSGSRSLSWSHWRVLRNLFAEFGAAEALDSLLIRPALTLWLPRWLHHFTLGVTLAKFAADLIFYVPTILSYELTKRRWRAVES